MDEDDDDIVAALRRGEDGWEYAAADEIEALRADNAHLQKDLHEYVMQAESGNQKQVAEMCELRKEIARLREAGKEVVDWWLRYAINGFEGAPAAMFNLRAALGDE